MATRTKKRPAQLAGRDSFHVIAPNGAELGVKGEAAHALVVAQGAAERASEEIVLTVVRRSLFGPTVSLYRVTRAADGVVYTNTNPED